MKRHVCTVLTMLLVMPAVVHAQFPFGNRTPQREPSILIVQAGQLLVTPGEAPLAQHSLIIRDGLIAEIRAGFVAADEVDAGEIPMEVLDLREHFVMPGLVDAHVHLARATGSYQAGLPAINDSPPVGEATVNALLNARLTLAAGVTSVRDLGSDPESVFAVRDAINAGYLLGPSIIASGPSVSVTGGRGDDARSAYADERARTGVCDGADECRTLVRHLEKTGANVIKLKVAGGFSSNTGLKPHMSTAELAAMTKAAHLRGIKVSAHAYAPEAIVDALEAGVDSIEHGYLIDDAGLQLMHKRGAVLVPMLLVAEPPSGVKRFLGGRTPVSVELRNGNRAFERAYAQGVAIAFGTDAGIYPHGRNADELVRMVELGMSSADAVRAATVVSAGLLGLAARPGTLAVGNAADLIAVRGSPLEDISRLTVVDCVVKDGRVVKLAGAVTPALHYELEQKY
jgi:imidazolonepropionase-like amidohydrolase